MAKPQITITISGAQGSGKSVLAQHLQNYLVKQHGVRVVNYDDMNNGQMDESYTLLPEYWDSDVTIITEVK
jgi:pantothenate kinase-related protein Tda10